MTALYHGLILFTLCKLVRTCLAVVGAINIILQGSAVTHFRSGGIFKQPMLLTKHAYNQDNIKGIQPNQTIPPHMTSG